MQGEKFSDQGRLIATIFEVTFLVIDRKPFADGLD